MSKWQKGYGIDDEGRRTIVITENKPNPHPVDRCLGFITRASGRITVILFICLIALRGLIWVGDRMNGFVRDNRALVVVAIVAIAFYFIGRVAKCVNGGPSASVSDDANPGK